MRENPCDESLPCVSQVGGDLQFVGGIIVYVLNGAVPSNVKRMSLIFKISKINLEYVAIFFTSFFRGETRRSSDCQFFK
jgi:hypothetical protein